MKKEDEEMPIGPVGVADMQVLEILKELRMVMKELAGRPAVSYNYTKNVYHAPVNIYNGTTEAVVGENNAQEEAPPTAETMMSVCEQTLAEGLWWGDASWGTAYQIFRQKGYKGGIDLFVDDVKSWPWKRGFPKKCNKYSVGDSARRGAITWPLPKWKEKGAQSREVKLGERIFELLSK